MAVTARPACFGQKRGRSSHVARTAYVGALSLLLTFSLLLSSHAETVAQGSEPYGCSVQPEMPEIPLLAPGQDVWLPISGFAARTTLLATFTNGQSTFDRRLTADDDCTVSIHLVTAASPDQQWTIEVAGIAVDRRFVNLVGRYSVSTLPSPQAGEEPSPGGALPSRSISQTAVAQVPGDSRATAIPMGETGATDDGFTIRVLRARMNANQQLQDANRTTRTRIGDGANPYAQTTTVLRDNYVGLRDADYALVELAVGRLPGSRSDLFNASRLIVLYTTDGGLTYESLYNDCGDMRLPNDVAPNLSVAYVTQAGTRGTICRAVVRQSNSASFYLTYLSDSGKTYFQLPGR